MQNYIDIKIEKQKAFANMLKKYAPAFFSVGIGGFLSLLEIVDLLKFVPSPENSIGVNFILIIGFLLVIIPSIWGVFTFFARDFVLFTSLIRNQFQIQPDYVEFIRPNNAKLNKNEGAVLKRYKIYFKNTRKTFDDSHFTNLQPGDFVYVWFNTNPHNTKIIHVTKIR